MTRGADGPRGGATAVLLGLAALLVSCGPRDPADLAFEVVGPESGLRFRHELPGGKLDSLPKAEMGGFAVLDLDGDGRVDVFCVTGGWDPKYALCPRPEKPAHHRLFRNLGGMRFEDVTEKAGVGIVGFGLGVCVGDIDGDGAPDLFVSQYGQPLLLHNRGDGTFEDVAKKAGIRPGFCSGSAFLDYDRDGDLDVFVGQYVDPDELDTSMVMHDPGGAMFPGPTAYAPQPSRLYRNRGDGTFEDVTRAAGVGKPGKAMGVLAADMDGDGWTDLVVANDVMPNFVWRNAHDGTFTDVGYTDGLAYGRDGEDRASMGVTFADMDGDGRRDVLVPDTRGGADYQAVKQWYTEHSEEWGLSGMSRGLVGWADVAFDPDCDGLLDLYRVHGDLRVLNPQPSFLVRNWGGGKFERVEPLVGGPDSVAEVQACGRSAIAADLDDDGREDLLVLVLEGNMRVFRNVTKGGGNWLRVKLRGKAPNPLAIGAVVRGRAGKRPLVREVASGSGYLSAGDLRLHFGLGDAGSLDDVVVRWPDGTEQDVGSLSAGREHILERR